MVDPATSNMRATVLACALIVAIEGATRELPERAEDGKALVADIEDLLAREAYDYLIPVVIAYLKAGVLSSYDFMPPEAGHAIFYSN